VEFKDLFGQEEKLNQTAYLADMCGLFDQFSTSLQRHNSSKIDFYGKVDSFLMKMDLRLSTRKEKKRYMFPVMVDRLEKSNVISLNESLVSGIKAHLLCLKEELSRYFPDVTKNFPLAKFPFTFEFDEIPQTAQEELTEEIHDPFINSEICSFPKHNFVFQYYSIIQTLKNLF
jgi:hypothetical protein